MGIVLMIVGAGVAVWLGAGVATGSSVTGAALGFVLFSLPFFAVGAYFLMRSGGEIKQQTKVDKQRSILDAVTTRGRVGVADLAIENDASRDEVRAYIYDLIGKGLFTGYVDWDGGELVSAEAANITEGSCPSCGGAVELAGKGLVKCPFCGAETYLSGPAPGGPAAVAQTPPIAAEPPPPAQSPPAAAPPPPAEPPAAATPPPPAAAPPPTVEPLPGPKPPGGPMI